jgi:hypothetical protein
VYISFGAAHTKILQILGSATRSADSRSNRDFSVVGSRFCYDAEVSMTVVTVAPNEVRSSRLWAGNSRVGMLGSKGRSL